MSVPHLGGDPNAYFPDLGIAHFHYSTGEEDGRRAATFEHETPSRILWDIIEKLLEGVLP
ncbi:hypothetical protein ACFQH6_04605 [Halobacteriaceae archaeon GCM10025711]